jgi:hypothetical protein
MVLTLGVDAIKVYVYRYWHLKLLAKIAPIPKLRKQLADREAAAAAQARVDANVQKMRNVVVEEKVILAMKPAGTEMAQVGVNGQAAGQV